MAGARTLRRRLVAELEARKCITSPAVRRAFLEVPRELFVPDFLAREGLEAVYRNAVVVTKEDESGTPTSSSSQPAIMALMLERLDLREGQRILEIGAGTGYNAALLSHIVGPTGRIVSIELDASTASEARRALRQGGYPARVVTGDGHEGWNRGAPYHRIVVTASTPTVGRAWFDQLDEGGLLEAPLRLRPHALHAVATLRKEKHQLRSVSVVPGGFMPLRSPSERAEPLAQLSVTEQIDGSPGEILELHGPALARLSGVARRRLVTVALSEPRIRRTGLGQRPWSLVLYLSLVTPARRLVGLWNGVGVAGRDGRSLALLRGRADRLDAYGGQEAEELLVGLVDRWKARGRPSEDDLSIVVDFRADPPRLQWSWGR